MSLREKQHMHLDSESARPTRMEGHSRSSHHKYLLLQVWCGLLTVSMVVMAALLSSIPSRPTEAGVSALKMQFKGSSPSYITLTKLSVDAPWTKNIQGCESCPIVLRNNSIHFNQTAIYFLYAQVTFAEQSLGPATKKLILTRNARRGRRKRSLVEGTFPDTATGSVWVADVVRLQEGDSVSIDISGGVNVEGTFWGAFQLH